VHHSSEVGEVVASTEPTVVTEYDPARRALSRLMAGQKLTEVLDSVKDPDLHRVLLAVAAMDGLYPPDKARNAALQIVAKLELQFIDRQIAENDRQLVTCTNADDTSSYFSLVRERQALQERKNAIRSRFAKKS
jgi:hypothetical protein